MAKLFKVETNKNSEKPQLFSVKFGDLYFQHKKNLIKNYIIAPDTKTVK